MNKYWKYELFPGFLEDVSDCTFVNMEELDIASVLNHITELSIQDFLYPKVELTYSFDNTHDILDGIPYGYYFTDENVGIAEYKVIWAFMKYYWMQTQITMDVNFRNPFFDSSIKGFSPANMLNSMRTMLEEFWAAAVRARFDYGRTDKEGRARWGQVNAK